MIRGKCKGYMTVEASLVLAIVFGVYLFLIRFMLWCYDRCTLELDVASVLLKCAVEEETELTWRQEKEDWNKENYIWVYDREMNLEKSALTMKIEGKAKGGTLGDFGIAYQIWRLNPQELLRLRGKLAKDAPEKEGEGKE